MAPQLVTNLKAVRVVATFKDGVQLAGSITYAEPAGRRGRRRRCVKQS